MSELEPSTIQAKRGVGMVPFLVTTMW